MEIKLAKIGKNLIIHTDSCPYEKLEYLQSSGTQWINTGLLPSTEMSYTCSFIPTQTSTRAIFSCQNDGYSGWFGCSNWSWNVYLNYFKQVTTKAESLPPVGERKSWENNIHTVTVNKDECRYDNGSISTSLTGDVVLMNRTIFLFGNNRKDGNYHLAQGLKILSFVVNKSDKISIANFIPVLNNDIPCMYDKVSKKCFYNGGTGQFGYKRKNGQIVEQISG